jgi:hypothetical protein
MNIYQKIIAKVCNADQAGKKREDYTIHELVTLYSTSRELQESN